MREAGIIHYPLFSRKYNTCSCTLFKINYCDAGSIDLSLDTDKMYSLSVQLSLNPVNRHTLHFKFTSKNTFYTLLKKLMEIKKLTFHFDKIFLAYGARYSPKQFLSLLQCKHGAVYRRGKKRLRFFNFSFQEKSIVENINIR